MLKVTSLATVPVALLGTVTVRAKPLLARLSGPVPKPLTDVVLRVAWIVLAAGVEMPPAKVLFPLRARVPVAVGLYVIEPAPETTPSRVPEPVTVRLAPAPR